MTFQKRWVCVHGLWWSLKKSWSNVVDLCRVQAIWPHPIESGFVHTWVPQNAMVSQVFINMFKLLMGIPWYTQTSGIIPAHLHVDSDMTSIKRYDRHFSMVLDAKNITRWQGLLMFIGTTSVYLMFFVDAIHNMIYIYIHTYDDLPTENGDVP